MASKVLIIGVIIVVIIISGVSSFILFQRSTYTLSSGPYHPNVTVVCRVGTYLANHQCQNQCPPGYQPVNMTNDVAVYSDSSPICMRGGQPVSIYDLAGLQVSADNGKTVYVVISNIPMMKMVIPGNYNPNIWLPMSTSTLANLTTVSSSPAVTTEVATLNDTVSTFKVLSINQTLVLGNVTSEYPVCCRYSVTTIHVGDDIGVHCLGISEILKVLDYQQNILVFTRTISPAPAPGCPI